MTTDDRTAQTSTGDVPAPIIESFPDTTTRAEPAPRTRRETVPWCAVGLFTLISWALMWAFALPFWFLADGISHPAFVMTIAVAMFTPAIASIIVAKGVERTSWRTRVGLRFRGRGKALLIWVPLSVVVMLLVALATTLLTFARGVPGDLTLGTWADMTTASIAETTGTEVGLGAALLFFLIIQLIGFAVTSISALGEEIGWRGWLWPALKPLGLPRAVALGGLIWSLWHLPIMLIGYNYPGAPRWAAILMFIPVCTALNLLFGAITERAQGNPIPAGLAHGAFNSLGSMFLVLFGTTATGQQIDYFLDTSGGLLSIVVLVCAAVLVMPWKRLRAAPVVES